MENNKENQKVAAQALSRFIIKKDFVRLEPALNLASEIALPKELLLKGHELCGDHYLSQNEYVAAIVHFNIARSFDRHNDKILDKCCLVLTAFYKENTNMFVVDDLKNLLTAFFLLKQQAALNTTNPTLADRISEVVKSIQHQKYMLPDEVEGKMTFKVGQVVDSFTKLNNYEDILERFAFLAEDDLRELYDTEEKQSDEKDIPKKKRKKKKVGDKSDKEE